MIAHNTIMLHVPGYAGGTRTYNADLLFLWRDTDAAVYRERWRTEIGQMLPDGLEIRHGVDYDFDDWFPNMLDARTPLWRAREGNCCPSGEGGYRREHLRALA